MASVGDINVLVVDDSRPTRMLLRSMLTAGGVRRIAEAATAEAAFAALRAPTDLVLLDWQMQPVDGLAFARMVRWRPDSPRPYVPIVMLTAHTEISRVAAARDAGVTGFVKKPISAQMLFARIGSALTDTRMYVQSAKFMGPDRRRVQLPSYLGPFRRDCDQSRQAWAETVDIDDLRLSA
jgi:CheY-like chemotaxis protein